MKQTIPCCNTAREIRSQQPVPPSDKNVRATRQSSRRDQHQVNNWGGSGSETWTEKVIRRDLGADPIKSTGKRRREIILVGRSLAPGGKRVNEELRPGVFQNNVPSLQDGLRLTCSVSRACK